MAVVKILITTIQMNFVPWHQNSPELLLLKFLPLTYHGKLMVKILITTIQMNFVPRPSGTKIHLNCCY